jgi:hypothetical protein
VNGDQPTLDFDPPLPAPAPSFAGDTYVPQLDRARLGEQLQRVLDVVSDGQWRTPEELEAATGDRWASISARLRDLRKPRFGGHDVQRQRLKEYDRGNFRYRLVR